MVVIYHPQLSRTGFYSASARLPFHSPNGILHYYGILLHYYAWTIFDGRNGTPPLPHRPSRGHQVAIASAATAAATRVATCHAPTPMLTACHDEVIWSATKPPYTPVTRVRCSSI
uniref:Uncharacterized protein n=1 Tax=Zea mays TaxID=4577 RepID=B6SH04_MAIZE|nr:hypothetical protein [Zea mays]